MKRKNRQLRFDFPDYSAAQQERDVERSERLKQKDVYVMRVNGVWNAYLPRPHYPLAMTGHRGEELKDFIKGVKKSFEEEMHIKPHFHNIVNQGIEDYIKPQTIVQNLLER